MPIEANLADQQRLGGIAHAQRRQIELRLDQFQDGGRIVIRMIDHAGFEVLRYDDRWYAHARPPSDQTKGDRPEAGAYDPNSRRFSS